MATTGPQAAFLDALARAILHDFDAIEAYDAAIERLESEPLRAQMAQFRGEHVRHKEELSSIVERLGGTPPREPAPRSLLSEDKGKVTRLSGDRQILNAIKADEDETNLLYARLATHADMPEDAAAVIRRARADEARHREWIVQQLAIID